LLCGIVGSHLYSKSSLMLQEDWLSTSGKSNTKQMGMFSRRGRESGARDIWLFCMSLMLVTVRSVKFGVVGLV
jgi:hypothetical protein